MAPYRTPGPERSDPYSPFCPAESPGPTGIRDQGDPGYCALIGDTPGPVGRYDEAAIACMADYVFPEQPGVCEAPLEETTEEFAIWVIGMDQLENYKKLAGISGSLNDTRTLVRVIQDFGFEIEGGQYYTKVHKGKTRIVFKGYSGLRRTLTETWYATNNPKVVNMMIGTKGLLKSAAKGGALSFVLVAGIEVVEFQQLAEDERMLSDLGVNIFSGLTKTVIASAVAFAAGFALASAASVAAAPIALGIAVGIGVSFLLDHLDQRFEITAKLRVAVRDSLSQFKADVRKVKRQYQYLNTAEGAMWLHRYLSYGR